MIDLFVRYTIRNVILSGDYETMQVNEAIMQNTSDHHPIRSSILPGEKPLSGFLSTYLSASFISWD